MTPGKEDKSKRLEVLLWSIAFPGFGQLLNKRYFKAFLFLILELMINIGGKVNIIIVDSFLLETTDAIQKADYGWLMFYPCIYLFAIWDAYRDAGGNEVPFMSIPFVVAAYAGTLGVIYSANAHIDGFYFGPIFLPILTMIVGFMGGLFVQKAVQRRI